MSGWIEEKGGKYVTTVADMDACKHMYNEVCCNDQSELCGGWPDEYDCSHCELFEREDGEV